MKFNTPNGPIIADIEKATIAGWTGRDAAAVQHHIEELAALGVAPPSTVPLYYRVSASLLTQDDLIEVLGADTSGEAEPLVILSGGQAWLGLASDHTDRALEAVSVAASKQICAKPVSSDLWLLSEVEDHMDQLELTCDIRENGDWHRYQEGTLASIRPLRELMAGADLREGVALFCGTLAALGGVRPAKACRMQLHDPKLGRTIMLAYETRVLPIIA